MITSGLCRESSLALYGLCILVSGCPSLAHMQRAGALEQGEVTLAAAGGIANDQGDRIGITPRVDLAARVGLGWGLELGAKAWPTSVDDPLWGFAGDLKWAFLDGGTWEASIGAGYGVDRGSDGTELSSWEGHMWAFPLLVGRNVGPHQAIAGFRVLHVSYGSSQQGGGGGPFRSEEHFFSPGVMLGFDAQVARYVHVMTEIDLHYDPAITVVGYFGVGVVVHLGAVPSTPPG